MTIQIFVLDNGDIQIMVDGPDVTFPEAEAATTTLLAGLQAQGFPLTPTSAIEQHRAGGMEHVHVQGDVHATH